MQRTKHKFYLVVCGLSAIILIGILSEGCNTSKKAASLVTQSPGEIAWRTACSKCHSLDDANPKGYPASQWSRIVNRMQNKKGGNQFSDEQKNLIIKYLMDNAIIKN